MINKLLSLWTIATAGWMSAGYYRFASTRVDGINPIWGLPLTQAVGVVVAMMATVGSFFVAQWWWGVVVFVTAPNLAALGIILLTPQEG